MKEKISQIIGPILNDIFSLLLWIGLPLTLIAVGYCILMLTNTQEAMERRDIKKRIRNILIAYLALHLVYWFVHTYLKPKVEGNAPKIASVQQEKGRFKA